MAKVLVVDDETNIQVALRELLKSWGHETVLCDSLDKALASLQEAAFDAVLVDVILPDGSGLELMKTARGKGIAAPFVVLTAHGSIEDAVTAMRLGAEDYLTKPVETPRLKVILDRLAEKRDMQDEVHSLWRQLRQAGTVGSLIGRSLPMQQLYTLIERVAPTDAAVFITGESGTGKTLVAKTVHEYSRRRRKPFLAVNCASIAPTLIESELFGHERGAFTGATQQRRGFFEEADGGTIFLDEITELPIELQGKLLHVLEENRMRRVGGNQEFDFNVRLISATNRNPKDAITSGKLREDLYYRVNIFPIQAPSLREHPDDIPFLAHMFLEKMCGEEDRTICAIDKQVAEILKAYPWPGNVRELRNVMNRALILARGDVITVDALPDYLRPEGYVLEPLPEERLAAEAQPEEEETATPSRGKAGAKSRAPQDPLDLLGDGDMRFETLEKRLIARLLTETANNKPLIAEKLGISLKTLYNKIKRYEL